MCIIEIRLIHDLIKRSQAPPHATCKAGQEERTIQQKWLMAIEINRDRPKSHKQINNPVGQKTYTQKRNKEK